MKIITVLDSYPPDLNGGAYFTHRLALGLKKKGHEILVICPSRSFQESYTSHEGVRIYGVRSFPALIYPNFRVCFPFGIQKRILKVIEDFKPDVIHIQGKFILGGVCYRLGKRLHIPLMATNHFMPENFFHYTFLPAIFESWFHRICWRIIVDMLSQVQVVTTPTQTAADLLKKVGFNREVHAISCGVDLQKFQPGQDATTIAQQFSIPQQPILLYTGRLDREKHLDKVIHAFSLARKNIEAHLVITGQGTERKRLEQLAKTLGIQANITFTGYLSDDDYPKIHGLATCFINACPFELQSIVGLEALASGLPILGVNAGALPELIIHDVNGYLFEPHDIETMASHMVNLLGDLKKSRCMGQESRKIAVKHDLHLTVTLYEELYKRMIRK